MFKIKAVGYEEMMFRTWDRNREGLSK